MKILNFVFSFIFFGIIVALFINIVSQEFSFDDIWNNGYLILFILSALLNAYLLLALYIKNRIIPESDKNSIERIFSLINYDFLELKLKIESSSIGFNDKDSINIEQFLYESQSARSQIVDKKLKELLNNFIESLNSYYQKFSDNAYSKNGIVKITPEIKQDHILYGKLIKELDKLAYDAYNHLTIFYEYANKYNIFGENEKK